MKISWSNIPGKIKTWHGYGVASAEIIRHWKLQGHEVLFKDPTAPVVISFCQPWFYDFYPTQYKIGYTPWESSQVWPDWPERMNRCDEIFATSRRVKLWFESNGITRPIYVFEHGIDRKWLAGPRIVQNKLRFLQEGSEPRKGSEIAVQAFRAAFGNDSNVELTVKGRQNRSLPNYPNVNYVTDTFTDEQMVELYHSHHAFLNLSMGEGFGFPGLQAILSSMPTLTTAGWSPYDKFCWVVDSRLVKSPVPDIHPGKMYRPVFDSVVDWLRMVRDQYAYMSRAAHEQSLLAADRFDWNTLTAKAIEHIASVTNTTKPG